jgi:hypothetical protein
LRCTHDRPPDTQREAELSTILVRSERKAAPSKPLSDSLEDCPRAHWLEANRPRQGFRLVGGEHQEHRARSY